MQRLHGGYGNDPLLDPPDFDGDGPQVIYPHLTPTIDSFPNTPFERRGMETLPAPEGMPLMPGSTGNELPRWRPAPVQTTEEIAQ